MARPPCCSEEKEQGLKKGPWTPDEDQKLVAYVQQHGHGSWRCLPVNAGLQRCGKSCRLRWTNYLRPDIKRGRFSQEEDRMIVHLHAILGNRWSAIASHLPRRTDNEIKNYWNTHLKKRLLQMGIDPVTHKSTAAADDLELDGILPALQRPAVSSTLSHMSQWDCARAEAEARLKSSLTSAASDFHAQGGIRERSGFGTGSPAKAAGTVQGASTVFMSSWRAQVAETLRPGFGVVELDRPAAASPINLQTFLRDWETSLQAPQAATSRSLGAFPAYDSPIDVPDFGSGTASPQDSPLSHVLPSPAQITERLLASRGCGGESVPTPAAPAKGSMFPLPQLGSGWESSRLNSPTSTLHMGPECDSPYGNSPSLSGGVGGGGDAFELLAQSLNSLIQQDQEQCRSSAVFGAEPAFWSRQPVAMADAVQASEPYLILPQLNPPKPSFGLSQASVPNSIPIPQFDFLC